MLAGAFAILIAKRSNIVSTGPVGWPQEAQEKSDQNEKLSERSEFFSFRFFLSIAAKAEP